MTDISEHEELGTMLGVLRKDAESYFDRAEAALERIPRLDRWSYASYDTRRNYFWSELPQEVRNEAGRLVERLLTLAGRISDAVRKAVLASGADQRDMMTGTKSMRAALFLREFRSWTTEVLRDEGTVLGVQPAGQTEDDPSAPESARRNFMSWAGKIGGILDLVAASRVLGQVGTDTVFSAPARYRPGSAFIIMSMDKSRPELTDVCR